MMTPVIHEKVRLKDRDGLFLVIRIDPIRRVVNLLPFDRGIKVLEGDIVLENVASIPSKRSQLREKMGVWNRSATSKPALRSPTNEQSSKSRRDQLP